VKRLALSIEGGASGFPRLEDVARWLEALELRAWIPARVPEFPPSEAIGPALPGVTTAAARDRPRGIVAAAVAERKVAVERLVTTARWAMRARANWVIVELGEGDPLPPLADAAGRERETFARLDRFCRVLHEAASREPDAGFALATPDERQAWLTPATLELAFEELGTRKRFAYWHDAGRAHVLAALGQGAATAWLDRHAHRCVGVEATDAIGTQAGLPPGVGEVDFTALLGAVSASAWVALRCDPALGPGPLHAAVQHLRGEPA
jgi:hypothetical protein